MNNGELLQIEPLEIQFQFELKQQITCLIKLTNNSDNYVAFKVKTTSPKKYCVRPNTGVVAPNSTCGVYVTMQAQREAPPDLYCRDKFLFQSVVVSPGITAKDITAEMFNKDLGNQVDERKLKVVYVAPVREGSEEGFSTRGWVSDNMSEAFALAGDDNEPEVKALIFQLKEQKQTILQQNNKLHQELEELLRRKGNIKSDGIPFMYVIIIGVIGILVGYLLKIT